MPIPPELEERFTQLGRGLVQANVRLGQVLEALGKGGGGPAEEGPALGALLDLVDALGETFARREETRGRRRWLPWARRNGEGAREDLWRGLALAREAALEHLAAQGIEPIPPGGPFDPALHRAVEARPAPAPALAGTVAATHRQGWVRREGSGRLVLRAAHVSVYAEGAEGGR
ncbi:MAG: nucleotide exchange factor GrpE [Planctomycetota bacterium]